MNRYLKLFRIVIWIGFFINMLFAIPALVAPEFLNTMLGLPMQVEYPWLENTGMLLIGISLFYLPAGIDPLRWTVYSWLCVLSRLIAVIFWIWLVNNSEHPQAFTGMMYSDGLLFVVLLVLLQLGLPAESKLSLANLGKALRLALAKIAGLFAVPGFRKFFAVAVVVVAIVGYTAWDNLLREVPQPKFSSAEEHFKYGAIGLGIESRIPLYLFEVMPEICSDLNDGKTDWSTMGFVYEDGKELPIGIAQRQIGYKSIEPTCSFCHTGKYQASPEDTPVPILAGPANTLNLEKFQWFMYDCAASSNFTASNILDAIEKRHELGFVESLYYRYAIVPLAKMGLKQQRKAYSWQKLRPTQGPGRTDTFNPTKIVVFGFPDDSTIGTVDLPQIWNQAPREGMWLHWDGNNNAIRERNYAAAMAVGATPESVLPESFNEITDWLLTKQPDRFPFPIDQRKADRGKRLWQENCADCHEFGKVNTGQVTTNIQELGTDRYRLDSFTTGLVDRFHRFRKPPFDFESYRKTQSYSNTPTDGIWARAPYLHNGSVPTLWDLLHPPELRPKHFYSGYPVYDPVKVGFVHDGKEAEAAGFLYDTTKLGNSNAGHLYGTDLSYGEKWDLIEYMKTL